MRCAPAMESSLDDVMRRAFATKGRGTEVDPTTGVRDARDATET